MAKTRNLQVGDAFGQEIWACYKRECCVFEIVERDDGYIDAIDPSVYFSEYDAWPQVERRAMEFVRGRVLDVGCGVGRHALYLQKKGLHVLGIDVSPLAIKVCKLRELKKAKVMSIEGVDFKRNPFETMIMMGNNFGLFGSLKRARRLLERFHRVTSENALIIADTRDPYRTDNTEHLKYHRLNRERSRMGGQVKIRIRFRRTATEWFDYLMVSREEMEEILKGTGWKIKELIDADGAQYLAILAKQLERT